jgi:thiamine-monophosphate kinase
MIDISDGLGSEVHHICHQSHVGAEIYAEAIPLHDDVRAAGKALGTDPVDFAISGGEDYELLFSISEDNLAALYDTGLSCHMVGKITAKKTGSILVGPHGRQPLPGGYNHFK